MKKIAFLLQTNYVLPLTTPVAYYARKRGFDVVDCTSSKTFDVMGREDWSRYDFVIPYGSVQLAERFKDTPLGFHIVHKKNGFDTDHWMSIYGELALNHEGVVMPATDLLTHLETHGPSHARPNSESKAFIATVFNPDSWIKHAQERNVRDDLQVFVSPPKKLEIEYRCWVIDGKVIEISQYLVNGELNKELCEDRSVHETAQFFANVYQPANAFVMDLAKTPDGFKLIEFNGFHGAGWYSGRIDKILDAYIAHIQSI